MEAALFALEFHIAATAVAEVVEHLAKDIFHALIVETIVGLPRHKADVTDVESGAVLMG